MTSAITSSSTTHLDVGLAFAPGVFLLLAIGFQLLLLVAQFGGLLEVLALDGLVLVGGDLGDLLVGVVPSLVHEVGVAGDRVDLAADLLEVLILGSEILQLGRAHEREVRRVEEEHRPVTEHVRLGHLMEFVVLKSLHRKISEFMLKQCHHRSFPRNPVIASPHRNVKRLFADTDARGFSS